MSFTQDIGRAYEIASILIQYGFGDAVRRLGLGKVLTEAGKLLNWQSLEKHTRLSTGERIRNVLEELGPTFVKLGQILSTRVDLFPPEMIKELERLQSRTAAVPFEEVREQLEEDLGGPVETLFKRFDKKEKGSASIAQVYHAELHDGTPVVVKVRRPKIKRQVEADLRLIGYMARLADKEMLDLKLYQPRAMADQFSRSLEREMDLAQECRHADRARNYLREDGLMVIPKVYWDYTSERVNVQERMEGFPGFDVEGFLKTGGNPVKIASDGAQTVARMVVEEGFFHADPHPGNVFYLKEDRYGLVDWGMVGRLTRMRRDQLVNLLSGMVNREPEAVRDILLGWSLSDEEEMNEEHLMVGVEEFLDKYHSVPLDEMDMATTFYDLTQLLRENRIALPADLALVFKVFITLEGFGRRLNPSFDMATEAKPVLKRAIRNRYRPKELWQRGRRLLKETSDMVVGLPREIRQVSRTIRKGKVRIQLDISQLDDFGQRVDDAASRVSLSFITAAFILSTSIVMSLGGGPAVYGVPLFDLLSYGAMIGGLFVLISILRSTRRKRK